MAKEIGMVKVVWCPI